MSGLSGQIIGDTYKNVYHLLLPYIIGDSRISYVPVYISNDKQTCLSLSKDKVKIGNYAYLNNAISNSPFYFENNELKQCTKFTINKDSFTIGGNTYKLSSSGDGEYILVVDSNGVVSLQPYMGYGTVSAVNLDGNIYSTAEFENIQCYLKTDKGSVTINGETTIYTSPYNQFYIPISNAMSIELSGVGINYITYKIKGS